MRKFLGRAAVTLALVAPTLGAAQIWTQTTGRMTGPRAYHTATGLQNGKVLVAGGHYGVPYVTYNGWNYLASAELYDPATDSWSSTGSMAVNRGAGHTATLLSTGKVLVAGGYSCQPNGPCDVLSSAELYDPATGTWSPTGPLATKRFNHTATVLSTGKVLVLGGAYYNGAAPFQVQSAELYDPATGTWSAAGGLATGREGHTATLVSGGKIVVAGGTITQEQWTASVEIFDPVKKTSSAAAPMGTGRYGHSATRLGSGDVLVAGGYNVNPPNATAETYSPSKGTWTATGRLIAEREDHTATLLSTGKVLVAAGGNSPGWTGWVSLSSAELYDPKARTWTATGSLHAGRMGHTATVLASGKVLVAGGWDAVTGAMDSAELY
jgi:N-acetylneuraminic acid mutarotase